MTCYYYSYLLYLFYSHYRAFSCDVTHANANRFHAMWIRTISLGIKGTLNLKGLGHEMNTVLFKRPIILNQYGTFCKCVDGLKKMCMPCC